VETLQNGGGALVAEDAGVFCVEVSLSY